MTKKKDSYLAESFPGPLQVGVGLAHLQYPPKESAVSRILLLLKLTEGPLML